MKDIKPDEKVCYNCKYLLWMVGIGQGLRCGNPTKEIKNQLVKSSKHTCDLFEKKDEK